MAKEGEDFSITQLLEWARNGEKKADETMGYPSMNPAPAAVAPLPGEEGVANPAQKALERSNQDPLDEAVGDTLAETKMKLMTRLEHQLGGEMAATSKAEDPKELPNAALQPAMPQTVATPAAPPGKGGPMPEPSMDMKMSSIFEEKGNEFLLASKEATEKGDPKLAQDLATKAQGYLDLSKDHSDAARKEAEAQAAVAALLGKKVAAADGGTNGAEGAPAGAEPTDEEKRAFLEQVADDYEGVGSLMGTKIASILEEKFGEEAFWAKGAQALGEALLPVLREKFAQALQEVKAEA